ncbi:glutamate:gamma-aminobutyrate antiporter [Castellaniella sp.]|uniref:glutamate:gamma-aminobutyrate antiporter n=1 Tax=Castellaniella sp. TaxID=1955812 RepID=UPI00355D4FF3
MSETKPTGTADIKQLSMLGFFAITASMVMAVYEYPTFATSGFSLVFFLLLGGFLWFIPVGLCSAEMATVQGWEEGGVFSWVSNSLGERWGFVAIACCYLEIAIGFIPMIYFLLGSLSFILNWPELNTDPVIKTIAGLVVLWVLTLTQFAGTKYTAKIAKIGFFGGILIPAAVLVILAIAYLVSGEPSATPITAAAFFPDFTKIGTLVVFVAFILSYMGVEASATHVNEMKKTSDYPVAILLLVIVAIVLSSLGGLAVAMTIPSDEINLSAGIVQAFNELIGHYGPHYGWVVRILMALLVLGVLAEVASWIVGPSRGMLVTAQKGILPHPFDKVNKHGVPVALVVLQVVITTVALIVLTNTGGGNNVSFLIAMALTVVIYLCTYFLLFLAYIHLIRKQKDLPRAFHVPGGERFKIAVAGIGFLISLLAFFVSFVPPSGLPGGETVEMYTGTLVIAFLIVLAIPFIVYALHSKQGKKMNATLVPLKTHNAPEGHFFLHPKVRPLHHIVVDKP